MGKRFHIDINVVAYKNNSFSFLSLQTFESLSDTAFNTFGLSDLAFLGHTEMHFMQEIHFSMSVDFGLSNEIAPAGHPFAQIPHPIHHSAVSGFAVDIPRSL